MKTLTELSGTQIRMAAKAIDEARRSLPSEGAALQPAPSADITPPAEPTAPAEPTDSASAAAEPAQAETAPIADQKPAAPAESDAVKAALDAAVTAATGLTGDRLARMREAVEAVGRRIDDVRLVRVFGPDEKIDGARAIGGFQYLVDYNPGSGRQDGGPRQREHGRGRGAGGRGFGRGGGGGGGGGKGPSTGGFSMDSLREDRRSERGPGGRRAGGGRPGGGRPGGGRPGGGRPGGGRGGGGRGGPPGGGQPR
ncbi:MAG: translation initiation factor 2 [Deltaproteobacteria bacterium]|nr:translation initiation factor 2 [Deltaproteobacteria bacterium]